MIKETEALGKQMLDALKGYVSRAIAPLAERLLDFERRLSEIPAGPAGPQGERGESIKGDVGSKGLDGKDGRDGRDGKDGRDGEHGRSALEIQVLPSIDSTKTYPAGTWAKYRGGLIRAIRDTTPITDDPPAKAGWDVIIEGIAGLLATQGDDPREITVAAMTTGGLKVLTSFRFPTMIYRGIFKDGDEYELGDVVTFGGSSWHCWKTTKEKPGTSQSWQLMVKRGTDGRDGTMKEPKQNGRVSLS